MMKHLVLAAAILSASQAFAAGFEKSIMWGGRTSGVAGIATPYITGSQALYFNPAGLANDKPGHEVSLNVSPTWADWKGPINWQNEEAKSETGFTLPSGLIYNGTIDDRFGFGIGGYVSGGANASYMNTPVATNTANVLTDLKIFELAVGAGYKVSDSLKLGLAYRVAMADANFAFLNPASASPATFANISLDNVKATEFTGFKLGAEYKVGEKTMLGLVYRSEINFDAEGDLTASVFNGTTKTTAATATGAKVGTTLPMAVTLGARHDYENWIAMAEYAWTQYSRVNRIAVQGTSGVAVNPAVETKWKDQHNIRLGGEYIGMSWPVRFGYGLTTQVTDKDRARATFTPPGLTHTLTLGTGHMFDLFGSALQFDSGAEYTFGSADGGTGVVGSPTTASRQGEHSVSSYALHLGLTYAF